MKHTTLLAAIASLFTTNTLAQTTHTFDWGSRVRYADIAASNSGQAASILFRGNVDSHWSESWSSFFEIDSVGSAFKDKHSDGVRLNGQPFIPDAPGTELNQAFVGMTLDTMSVRLGRQRINIDNQRFIGGNGFWQNEQTFDALFSQFKLASHSRFTYSYIANTNRIFGEDATKDNPGRGPLPSGITPLRSPVNYGDHKQQTHLTHLQWNEWDYTSVSAYAYRMKNIDMPAASNATFGASYTVNYKVDRVKYRVQIAAAQQDRFELARDGLPYYLVDAGVGIDTVEFITRYEVLGEKNGAAFITPLGSNHKFEGWAGVVGNTPNTGVRNASVGLLWRASPIRFETHYHIFNNDLNGNAIGKEWDMDISFRPIRKHNLSLRLAHFEPENNSHSVRKVFLDYSFNL